MPLHEVLKEIDATLYPDIAKAGSLDIAISKSLSDIGSKLIADGTEVNKFMPYARVEKGSRFSQIHIAGGQRLFLFDFWSEGIVFGNASREDISDVARAINAWIADKSSIEKMSALFKFFSPSESGKAHEAGVYVEHEWQSLLESWRTRENPFKIRSRRQLSYFLSLNLQLKLRFVNEYFFYLFHSNKKNSPIPLIKAAMKKPELRQLFPYTSLNTLCFSRTTGYPFTNDCPSIASQGNGKYCVYAPSSRLEIIGEGTIDEVMEIAIKNLPPNCGAAVNGTADDFAL
jgi:hypothetical protein